MHSKSHYDTLNVNRHAKPEAISAAYEALVQKCRAEIRPDADPSRYLKAIGDAHAVLSDPEQRTAYDLWLQEQDLTKTGARQPAPKSTSLPANNARSSEQHTPPISSSGSTSPEATAAPGKLRIAMAALLFLVIAGLYWFYTAGTAAEHVTAPATKSADAMETDASPATAAQLMSEGKTTEVTEIAVPDHDRVALENYLGSWQGGNDTPVAWRKLDIRKKSGEGFVFQLDSKSTEGVGEVYGVATFRNGYALFFSQEYGCSIVFSMKSGVLNVNTSGCQAYQGSGAGFDGRYVRPGLAKNSTTAGPDADTKQDRPLKPPKSVTAPVTASAVTSAKAPDAPAANPGKLYRFVATVRNAEGKTERIELVAANEEAARAILRDFRGNPTVVRIRRAWF